VFERLLTLPEVGAARSVMCFASFRSEVDTLPFIEWSLRQGKRVALPRIVGRHHMEAFWVTDPAVDLEVGSYGIREPREGSPPAPPEMIDLVVVPGSAFDRSGDRVGYGGGYYDSFLPRLRPGTPRIAVAFHLQVVDDVPGEEHDLRVDALVTERGVMRFSQPDEERDGGAA
jgi:5-formyltetrahydrofolate cyclo-ligase